MVTGVTCWASRHFGVQLLLHAGEDLPERGVSSSDIGVSLALFTRTR
jgi:hypothetical protein